MNPILNRLESYGVNLANTMARFVDDEELYIDCLNTFMSDPDFEKLNSSIMQNDYIAAFDSAHTLKGVAGNLGVTPLYNAICEIVEPMRHHEYNNLSAQYDNIIIEKQRLAQVIEGKQK